MATNMFVTNIPNGTSLDVQKGTALNLLKLLIGASREDSKGGYIFDIHRIEQLAGCLGIAADEAIQICQRVIKGESAEQVVNEIIVERKDIREQTVQMITDRLKEVRS